MFMPILLSLIIWRNNTQCYYDPTTQHFMLDYSSELRSENSKGYGYGGLHVINILTLNDYKFGCRKSRMGVKFVHCRLPHIYIWYFVRIKKPGGGGRETDDDSIYGHKFLPVNNNLCIPHCQNLPKRTTSTVARIICMSRQRVLGKLCMVRGKWIMAPRNNISLVRFFLNY